jgi:PAS domain S-box-containing protein
MVRSLNGTIRYWSHAAEQFYGWSRTDAVGRRSHDIFRTQFPKPLPAIEAELLDKGLWEGTLLHTRRDGTQVNVFSRWELQRDAQHRPVVVLEINTIKGDGSAGRAKFGSWTWELKTNTMTWSDEMSRLYGVGLGDERTGYEPFLTGVPPEDRVIIETMFERALRERQPFAFLYRLSDAAGRRRTIQLHGEVVSNGDEVVCIFGAAVDVTDPANTEPQDDRPGGTVDEQFAAHAAELAKLRRELESLRTELMLRARG